MPDLRTSPYVVPASATLAEAMDAMTRGRRGAVVIVDGMRVVGLLTDGIVRRALLAGAGMNTPVAEVMGTEVVTVNADDGATRADPWPLFASNTGLHIFPVVDAGGILVDLIIVGGDATSAPRASKKAVVTGGAGFIGSHVADALIARGFETHVIDNLSGGKREHVPAAAIFHEVDILDTKAVEEIARGAAVLFHKAALPQVQFSIDHPIDAHRVNSEGTLSVLTASAAAGVGRVIYAASAAAYGNQDAAQQSEAGAAGPVNPYGLHKYMGEFYCKMFADIYGLPTVSLRYFNVYGPRMNNASGYGAAIARFLDQKRRGEKLTIVGDGEQTRDFVHVHDVVEANLRAMESTNVGRGEVINIGSGAEISINALADLIDPDGERESLPPRAESRRSRADISLARRLLAWEPTHALPQGIRRLMGE